jgi:hypothetical protein
MILLVKCYIDNYVCLRSCIRNINMELTEDMWKHQIGKQLFHCEGLRTVHAQDPTAMEKTLMWTHFL